MDARSAGALGGRPTKATALGKSVAAVERGSQLTLNFGGTLTLSGPVTIKATVVNIGAGAGANLLGAFDDAGDGPDDEADGQDDLAPDAADGAAA